MAKNTIGHVEWCSTDLEKSKSFFEQLFGWTFSAYGSEFYLIKTDGGIGGSLRKVEKVENGTSAVAYIEVDNIDDCLLKVQSLGGGIVQEKQKLPDMGYFAQFNDPDGNTIGLYQEA